MKNSKARTKHSATCLRLKNENDLFPYVTNSCWLVAGVISVRRTGMAMRVSPSQSRDDSYHHPWLNPAAPGHMTSMRLVASCGVEIHRLQRPSIRAGSHTHHPILSASCDESWKAQRRRPHLSDGVLCRPGKSTGRLHQHPDRGMTPHQPSTYTFLSTAPAGITPVSRKRQSAMNNLRATATIPIRRKRLPPPPKRSRNHTLRALSGCKRSQLHANSVVIQRTCRLPALVIPCSRACSPL